jgi:alkylation response protein AidB-like acyl-CoA dehydrogenase
VRLSDASRLGAEGDGWRVAVTTLMNERVSIGGAVTRRGGGPVAEAIKLWKERWQGDTSAHAMALRDRLVSSYIRMEALSMTNSRAAQTRKAGTPGPEGSVAKLAYAEENKRIYELCLDLMGADGMVFPAGYPMVRPDLVGMNSPDPRKMFLRVRANSIEGGTSEVMRNILGERVLGLPGDVRTDKELPWKDVPRS